MRSKGLQDDKTMDRHESVEGFIDYLTEINFPIHGPTYKVATNGKRGAEDSKSRKGWWLYTPMEPEAAKRLCRMVMFDLLVRYWERIHT